MSRLTPEQRSEVLFRNTTEHDCGVIALQALTNIPREQAEQLAARYAGFDAGVGTPRYGLAGLLGKLAFTLENIPTSQLERQTVATFALANEYGKFLLYIESHVMALVEGDLLNGRSFSHDPLEMAIKVKDECKVSLDARVKILLAE